LDRERSERPRRGEWQQPLIHPFPPYSHYDFPQVRKDGEIIQ